MAAILNGLLPSRKKDYSAQERMLNTRWGDAAISAPIHGGWSTNASTIAQSQSSPDLDRDLPPTPPQNHNEQDGVFIVQDEEGQDDSEDDLAGANRENATLTIPLPWKKKKAPSHTRKSSLSGVLNPRYEGPRRMDLMPPPLATAEAAAVPLPESRISSPVGRTATTSPVLSFRSRLASPNLGDILSPVAEGFAKEGPSSRPTQIPSSLQFVQTVSIDRPPTAGSMRSNMSRRQSLTLLNGEGIGTGTMSSQGLTDERPLELSRPPSRGLGATAHMRASSRGPRANSRGPRAPSVDSFARRAPSAEPVNRRPTPQALDSFVPGVHDMEPVRRRAPSADAFMRRAASVEPVNRRPTPQALDSFIPGVHDMEPVRRRAPSVEPSARRAPSVEPVNRRATPQAVESIVPGILDMEPVRRRAPSVEPVRRRGPSIEPVNRRAKSQAVESFVPGILDMEPVRQRAPSMEPARHRAPSVGPEPVFRRAPSQEPGSRRAPSVGPGHSRRVVSREPRGRRRGLSVEPKPKVRFLSEAPRPTHRPDSFSSNDGSVETESDNDGSSESKLFRRGSHFNTRRPRRRRSIASPISSPTAASFGITQLTESVSPPILATNFDSIAARAGLVRPQSPPPPTQRTAPRNRSQSRTRGLYADMHDDFRLLGRDVHIVKASANHNTSPPAVAVPSPVITQAAANVLSSNSILQRTPSPALSSTPNPTRHASTMAMVAPRIEPERAEYASDSSSTGLPSVSNHLHNHQHIHIHSHNQNLSLNHVFDRPTDVQGGKAMLAALAHERRDQLRREDREAAREKIARKLEREREKNANAHLALAGSAFSDCESVASTSGHVSGSEKTRRVYGYEYESDTTTASASASAPVGRARGGSVGVSGSGGGSKTLVPSAEEIWG